MAFQAEPGTRLDNVAFRSAKVALIRGANGDSGTIIHHRHSRFEPSTSTIRVSCILRVRPRLLRDPGLKRDRVAVSRVDR